MFNEIVMQYAWKDVINVSFHLQQLIHNCRSTRQIVPVNYSHLIQKKFVE